MTESVHGYEIEMGDAYRNEEPIRTQIRSLMFRCENVSFKLAPELKISSGWGNSVDHLIAFDLEPQLAHKLVVTGGTSVSKTDKEYSQSPDERYTFRFSNTDGWSVLITPKNRNQGMNNIPQHTSVALNDDSFLRVLHSFFDSVI